MNTSRSKAEYILTLMGFDESEEYEPSSSLHMLAQGSSLLWTARFWPLLNLQDSAMVELHGSSKLQAPKINPSSQIRFPITYISLKVC